MVCLYDRRVLEYLFVFCKEQLLDMQGQCLIGSKSHQLIDLKRRPIDFK